VRRYNVAAGIAAAAANAAAAAAAAGGGTQPGDGGPGALFGGGDGGTGALFREGGQRDSDEAVVGTPLSRHGRTPSWSQRLNTLGQRLLGSPRSPNRGGRGASSPFGAAGRGAHLSTSHLNLSVSVTETTRQPNVSQ